MPFSNKDKAVIKNLYQFKKYGLQRILTEFSITNWKRERLGILVKRLEKCEALTKGMSLQTKTRAFYKRTRPR